MLLRKTFLSKSSRQKLNCYSSWVYFSHNYFALYSRPLRRTISVYNLRRLEH